MTGIVLSDEAGRGGLLEEVTFRLRLGEWEEFSRVHSRQTERFENTPERKERNYS